jgi:hypothetical protein
VANLLAGALQTKGIKADAFAQAHHPLQESYGLAAAEASGALLYGPGRRELLSPKAPLYAA